MTYNIMIINIHNSIILDMSNTTHSWYVKHHTFLICQTPHIPDMSNTTHSWLFLTFTFYDSIYN